MRRTAIVAASLAGIVGLGTLHGAVANAEEINYSSGSVEGSASVSGAPPVEVSTSYTVERNDDYWLYAHMEPTIISVGGQTPVYPGQTTLRLCGPEQGPVTTAICDAVTPAIDGVTDD